MSILRKIFLDDWLTKLFALGITLALWFGVTGLREPFTTRFTNISLQMRLSNDFEITNSIDTEVAIVITGDKGKIEELKSGNLVASVDLTEAKAGEQIVQLTPDSINVSLPTGVKVIEVQPNKIVVKIEAIEERDVAVRAETEGDLAENFEIYSMTVLPQKVRVRAPSSFIRSLQFVSTEKIDISNRQTDFTAKQVKLNIANPKATTSEAIVDVLFRIGEKRIEQSFSVTFQIDGETKKTNVVLYGARSVLERLNAENLQIEAVKNDAGEYDLRLILPDEVKDKIEIKQPPTFKTK